MCLHHQASVSLARSLGCLPRRPHCVKLTQPIGRARSEASSVVHSLLTYICCPNQTVIANADLSPPLRLAGNVKVEADHLMKSEDSH